jgi:hypothetical protein
LRRSLATTSGVRAVISSGGRGGKRAAAGREAPRPRLRCGCPRWRTGGPAHLSHPNGTAGVPTPRRWTASARGRSTAARTGGEAGHGLLPGGGEAGVTISPL